MNQLPCTWEMATIDAVCVPTEQAEPDLEGSFTYVDIGAVDRQSKRIVGAQQMSGSEAPSRARKLIRAGDTLVSMTRPNLNAVALVPPELDGQIASTGFEVLRSPGLDPRWVAYQVRTEKFVSEMSALVQGALYPAIRGKDVRSFKLPIAPLAEQHRIANKLDTVLARVDAVNTRLTGIAPLLDRFRQSVLNVATSGKLTSEWRLSQGLTEPKTVTLGELIKVSSGNGLTAKDMRIGNIPVFGGNGINGRHDRGNVSEPTIVIGRVGFYCGSVYLTPPVAWVTDNALVVRFDKGTVSREFLYYGLLGTNLRQNMSSTAQPVISGQKIYPLTFKVPNMKEQIEIVRRIKILLSCAERLEARVQAAQSSAQRLTPALLAKAFRGELVPQDENDEPASELLRRLAESKSRIQPPGKKTFKKTL